jgi:hypothetical protein
MKQSMEKQLNIIELRNYLIKPNRREEFAAYFSEHFIDSQLATGLYPLGQFRIKNLHDRFFWIRGFENMHTRGNGLPAFYESSEAWKTYGPEANEMMLEFHNVYLVKPMDNADACKSRFDQLGRVVVVNYYLAKEGCLQELITLFNELNCNGSLWISEMEENNYERLPVIQDENLLVSIASYESEEAYYTSISQCDEFDISAKELIRDMDSLVLYRM